METAAILSVVPKPAMLARVHPPSVGPRAGMAPLMQERNVMTGTALNQTAALPLASSTSRTPALALLPFAP